MGDREKESREVKTMTAAEVIADIRAPLEMAAQELDWADEAGYDPDDEDALGYEGVLMELDAARQRAASYLTEEERDYFEVPLIACDRKGVAVCDIDRERFAIGIAGLLKVLDGCGDEREVVDEGLRYLEVGI